MPWPCTLYPRLGRMSTGVHGGWELECGDWRAIPGQRHWDQPSSVLQCLLGMLRWIVNHNVAKDSDSRDPKKTFIIFMFWLIHCWFWGFLFYFVCFLLFSLLLWLLFLLLFLFRLWGFSNHIFNFFYVLLLLLWLSVVLCLLLFVFWGSFSFYSIHEAPIFWPPDVKHQLIGKDLMLGQIEGKRRRGGRGWMIR